jgi:hypothetical protein
MKRQTRSLALPLLAAILSLAGCVHTPASAPAAAATDELHPIDVHTHTIFLDRPEASSGVMMSEKEYFAELSEIHAAGALALVIPKGLTAFGDVETEHDLRSRGVFNCVGLTARVDAAALEKKLRSGLYRCIKIYLGYVPQYAYDPHYEPAYRLAEKYDVPVIFHTGDTYSGKALLKYAQPLTIDEVAVKHPKTRFVIAHCGNPWIEDAAELAYKNDNVYLDGSGLAIGDLDKKPEWTEEYFVKPLRWVFGFLENPRKLMYGTDWPLVPMGPYFRAFKRAIPREHWQAVFHDNAARVFNVDKNIEHPPVQSQ